MENVTKAFCREIRNELSRGKKRQSERKNEEAVKLFSSYLKKITVLPQSKRRSKKINDAKRRLEIVKTRLNK